MIKRFIILFSFLSVVSFKSHAQSLSDDDRLRDVVRQYGQAEVAVAFTDRKTLDYISSNVSVLNLRSGMIEISLSPLTVEWFISRKYSYVIREKVASRELVSAVSMSKAFEWDTYPSYTQYDSIMHSFQLNYPALCHLDTIGTSINGKLILALKISDNHTVDEAEPDVFYTSGMHGDETGGFILMLRLADYLLRNYSEDARVKELIDNLEIWINPLANPDGTYNSGNTITSPVRYNAHGVDLNRNFPDPEIVNMVYEKETIDMIRFMGIHKFVISANFHSGTEVVNYPWDRWLTKLHADNNWFNSISRSYADTVHLHCPPGYMTYLDNGVTRGAVWYIVHGGRQDYMTQQLHGREVTIELDNNYITPVSQLSVLWESNWRSLIGYLENALYGVHGEVMDSESSLPVAAEIFIKGHDIDDSQVHSDTLTGSFIRLLEPGIWPLTFTATGYRDTTLDVSVYAGQKTDLQVHMKKGTTPVDSVIGEPPVLYPNPATAEINAILTTDVSGSVIISIFDQTGKSIVSYEADIAGNIPFPIDISRLSAGTYSVIFFNARKNKSCRGRFIVIK
jgi:hypothetical protein